MKLSERHAVQQEIGLQIPVSQRNELPHGLSNLSFMYVSGHSDGLLFNMDKKLSYCWETVRRESMPRIAEMDVEMTT